MMSVFETLAKKEVEKLNQMGRENSLQQQLNLPNHLENNLQIIQAKTSKDTEEKAQI